MRKARPGLRGMFNGCRLRLRTSPMKRSGPQNNWMKSQNGSPGVMNHHCCARAFRRDAYQLLSCRVGPSYVLSDSLGVSPGVAAQLSSLPAAVAVVNGRDMQDLASATRAVAVGFLGSAVSQQSFPTLMPGFGSEEGWTYTYRRGGKMGSREKW